jgi:predicted phosphohydrolase
VLIKGNHCTWWQSRSKVEKVLHPSIRLLQNDAVKLPDGTVVIGTRLWDPPERRGPMRSRRRCSRANSNAQAVDPGWPQARRLRARGARTIALVHYPPRYSDGRETAAVPMLKDACVQLCVYGHLHGKDHKYGFQGEADGIRYYLAAVDAIDFRPIPIELR